ncbi:hypothetical protein EUGRSUZ_K02209 [Eucalyptus grandis]|uniref:PLAC8 family protein n=2 Tax=Eucalyptus grandis TaxID=71139 RepID=A0A059A474_EUCGR|nr:hypothetical protein EUGRSUZ_K02209 [Eucalyptus grandis]
MDEDASSDTWGEVQAAAGVAQAATGGVQATPATAHFSQANVGAPGHNVPNANVGEWTTSLCGCFGDISNCFITCVSPCITFGQNAEIIDRGNIACMRAASLCCLLSSTWIFSFFYTCTYRTKLRGLYSIRGNQCGDCFAHLCCQPCALCQEYRELKNRGFNPSFGWVANQERRTQQVKTMDPPSVPGKMIR